MADSFVQLPDDSGNTGKKIHTQTRVVGADVVHEHAFNIIDPLPAGNNNIGDVDVVSLPATAASAAKQDTGNASLTNIEMSAASTDTNTLNAADSLAALVKTGGDSATFFDKGSISLAQDAANAILVPLQVDAVGRLRTVVQTALPAGSNKIGSVDTDADAVVGDTAPNTGLAAAGISDDGKSRLLRTHTDGTVIVGGVTAADGLTTPLVTTDDGLLLVTVSGPVSPTVSATGTPAGVTVSTTAVLLKAGNNNRRSIIITNNGSSIVYLGHTSGVTTSGATMGLYLAPNGGTYRDSGFGLYVGDIYGIGSAISASQNVSVSERT